MLIRFHTNENVSVIIQQLVKEDLGFTFYVNQGTTHIHCYADERLKALATALAPEQWEAVDINSLPSRD